MKPQFLIAAPSSNSGKTTVTLGILRILSNKGYKVQPFKCGPDYIDPKHHSLAAGRESINLDTYMMGEEHVAELYQKYSSKADVLVTEGVMGLFDGANKWEGSSAGVALHLDLPVILVINAKAMAYSVAPLIFGFKNFNPDLKIAGVIFNYVNTESHYHFLKQACDDTGVESLGYIPANEKIKIPSRHLGLAISQDNDYESIIANAAEHIAKTVDITQLLKITTKEVSVKANTRPPLGQSGKFKIAVARDDAFNFTYYENIEALRHTGEVIFFSPLNDQQLPEADLVYLAGGYPELYLQQLSCNYSMKDAILNFCQNGGKVLAECGGMMYLGKEIVDSEGTAFPMVNYLDIQTSMQAPKLSLGYRNINMNDQSFTGHEFHYSTLKELSSVDFIGHILNARGMEVPSKIYKKQNVIAGYIHFYWGTKHNFPEVLYKQQDK